MVRIEVFFSILAILFGLIGMARGFLRELGVTIVIVFVLFVLSLFDPAVGGVLAKAVNLLPATEAAHDTNLFGFWLVLIVIVVAAFISYEGETLTFSGKSPTGSMGLALGLTVGLFNGYLIAGSIWYYMDRYNYPISALGFSGDTLSSAAQAMIPYLPMNFLGQPILLGQNILLYLTIVLIVARVIR